MAKEEKETLSQYLDTALFPALLEDGWITKAFPDMNLSLYKNNEFWVSSTYMDGSVGSGPSKRPRTFIAKTGRKFYDWHENEEGLIDRYMREHNLGFRDAVDALADCCGISRYEWGGGGSSDSEEGNLYKARREALETMCSALMSDEGTSVREYLSGRGWTDEDIENAARQHLLGVVNKSILSRLPQQLVDEFGSKSMVGISHQLVIAVLSGQHLRGYKFRRTDGENEKKYLNSRGLEKSSSLSGIRTKVDGNLVIVEGDLDMVHPRVRGMKNVVSTMGGSVSIEQAKDALKRGAKSFILLLDNDEYGQKFVGPSISNILQAGGNVLVSHIDGAKDSDEYLTRHTVEEWRETVSMNTETLQVYKTRQKAKEAHETPSEEERQGFLRFIEQEACNIDSSNELDHYLNALKAYESRFDFSVAHIKEQLGDTKDRKRQRDIAEMLSKASIDIANDLKGGNITQAVQRLNEAQSAVSRRNITRDLDEIFAAPSATDIASMLAEVDPGRPTGIEFRNGSRYENLTIGEGLTFICGYRAHGKTSLLNNFALNEAKRNLALGNGKSVLYFSFEVSKRMLVAQLLNTFTDDEDISDPKEHYPKKPLETILSHFYGEGNKHFNKAPLKAENGQTTSHYQNFLNKKNLFFSKYLEGGALRIIDVPFLVEELLEAIKYYTGKFSTSMVCIDYAQLLYSEERSRQRTEEIKSVVNKIKDFAKAEGIPFLLACQFNRQVSSPLDVDTINIGEGGDFERIADTCLGLFSLKELSDQYGKTDQVISTLSQAGLKVRVKNNNTYSEVPYKGPVGPIWGKLFVRLMKRRYGDFPLDTVLDWHQTTGKIVFGEDNPSQPTSVEIDIPTNESDQGDAFDLPF